jgi:Rha family phage regulatory protein
MNELTIIKRGDAAYIDSREVAEAIGKRHKDLLRDIRKYDEIISRFTGRIFTPNDFFVESTYFDPTGRELPCYLITRRGADVIANKLTGEKGVLFTAAYVTKFHEMSECEHQQEIDEIKAQAVTPRLQVFNAAVRSVLSGYNDTCASGEEIMGFLQGAYKPFGIEVIARDTNTCKWWGTATDIAQQLHIFSEYGRYHAHAAAAIIEKLKITPNHFSVMPYGLVGVSLRYDRFVLNKVNEWLATNNYPHNIPHNGFEYHVHYDIDRALRSLRKERERLEAEIAAEYDDGCFDDEDYEYTAEELDALCGTFFGDCDECPGLHTCCEL